MEIKLRKIWITFNTAISDNFFIIIPTATNYIHGFSLISSQYRMFANYHRTKERFEFLKDTDEVDHKSNNKYMFHVSRVMRFIGTVVDHVDHLEEVVPMLKQLGGRHGSKGYDIPAYYFTVCIQCYFTLRHNKPSKCKTIWFPRSKTAIYFVSTGIHFCLNTGKNAVSLKRLIKLFLHKGWIDL